MTDRKRRRRGDEKERESEGLVVERDGEGEWKEDALHHSERNQQVVAVLQTRGRERERERKRERCRESCRERQGEAERERERESEREREAA